MSKPTFDHVVSLGRNCLPSAQIRRYTGVNYTLPFDWVVSPDAGVRMAIRTGLAGWFDRDALKPDPTGGYRHEQTGIHILHSFEKYPDFATGYEANVLKMTKRVLRWLDLVSSDSTVLFVRIHRDEEDPRQSAADLVGALLEGTTVGFELLYLVDPSRFPFDPDWRVEGVTFAAHRRDTPEHDWPGCTEDWDGHFARMGIARAVLPADAPPAPVLSESAAAAASDD